jgi:hypothetical protein
MMIEAAPSSMLEVYQRFRGICCLHHHCLMTEAANTSETLVNFYQTTQRYNPEDSHLHTRRRENLKSYINCCFRNSPYAEISYFYHALDISIPIFFSTLSVPTFWHTMQPSLFADNQSYFWLKSFISSEVQKLGQLFTFHSSPHKDVDAEEVSFDYTVLDSSSNLCF